MAIKISNSTIIDDDRRLLNLKSSSASIVTLSSSAYTIDVSTGSYFKQNISSSRAYSFTGAPASVFYAFAFELSLSLPVTITWPSSVKWVRDLAPVLGYATSVFDPPRTNVLVFMTDDGGTIWRGSSLLDYAS